MASQSAPAVPVSLYPPPPPPPGYVYQFRYAGMLERFGAVFLDFIVLLVVAIIVAIPFGIWAAVATVTGSPSWVMSLLFGPLDLIMFLLWVVYFTYFESTSGQTLGKRVLRLRVVSVSTGRPPDLGRSLLRNILRIIDWLPAFFLLGFVVALLTQKKQRLGDLLADTVVVKA